MHLKQTDPEIAGLIEREGQRQASTLELIASENHVSAAVMEAAGTVLTILPMLAVFLFTQRFFMRGMDGAIK